MATRFEQILSVHYQTVLYNANQNLQVLFLDQKVKNNNNNNNNKTITDHKSPQSAANNVTTIYSNDSLIVYPSG